MKYIFDFDDVLFNNTEQFKKHMFRLIAEAGVPLEAAREYYYRPEVHGQEFSLKKFISDLFSKFGIEVPQDGVYETIMSKCPEFRNMELVEALRSIPKKDRYIVTNGHREFNMDKLKYSGIYKLFDENNIFIVPGSKKDAIDEIRRRNTGREMTFIDNRRDFLDGLPDYPNFRKILYKKEKLPEIVREITGERPSELRVS